MENCKCPNCGGEVFKHGFLNGKQRYRCKVCGYVTTAPSDASILQKLDKKLEDKVF